jgi:hypothetical protein
MTCVRPSFVSSPLVLIVDIGNDSSSLFPSLAFRIESLYLLSHYVFLHFTRYVGCEQYYENSTLPRVSVHRRHVFGLLQVSHTESKCGTLGEQLSELAKQVARSSRGGGAET